MQWDISGLTLAFFAPAVVAAAVSWIFQLLMKGKVDHYFNERLEKYRQELGVLTEGAKFDYQRILHDFGIYSPKRHSAYAQIYGRLHAAIDLIDTWVNVTAQEDRFVELTRAELSTMLEVLGAQNTQEGRDLLDEWPTLPDEQRVKKGLDFVYDFVRLQFAARSATTEHFIMQSRLYLRDDVADAANAVLAALRRWSADDFDPVAVFRNANTAIDYLRQLMQAGLAAGDYSEGVHRRSV